ncbi:unnamed protein product [Arctia plantaginis]|uniref:Uncharacterized protein n=1 Tax=Arctia plantaginis TaxID=874455 RepID=A0A8S0ZMG7_ARCPL|nr:unnamed protein product [Arctia plantaginis]
MGRIKFKTVIVPNYVFDHECRVRCLDPIALLSMFASRTCFINVRDMGITVRVQLIDSIVYLSWSDKWLGVAVSVGSVAPTPKGSRWNGDVRDADRSRRYQNRKDYKFSGT